MGNAEPETVRKLPPAATGVLALVGLAVVIGGVWALLASKPLMAWLTGAAALGLLSGFTLGASKQPEATGEFFKFLSGGILVPFAGAWVALLQHPQKLTETYEYVGDLVRTKTTEAAPTQVLGSSDLLAVLGGFFVYYGVFGVLGIVLGSRFQDVVNLKWR